MKSTVLFLLIILISSCKQSESIAGNKSYTIQAGKITSHIFTDSETGCQYLVGSGFMTPRLGSDGFPLCGNTIPVGEGL